MIGGLVFLYIVIGIFTCLGQLIYSDTEEHIPVIHIWARTILWPLVFAIFIFKCLMWVITKQDWWLE